MCDHNTGTVIYSAQGVSVEICDWGCNKILIYKDLPNGVTRLMAEYEHPELVALRAKLEEAREIIEMLDLAANRDEIESVKSRAREWLK